MKRNVYNVLDTAAQRIYDVCCERFGWNKYKRGYFGKQQLLYAEDATPEGYSVWFLTHNNWTQTLNGAWYNKINADTIEEIWKTSCHAGVSVFGSPSVRVTFAKTKYGYVFVGLFVQRDEVKKVILEKDLIVKGEVFKKAGEPVWIKTYDMISDEYPM